MFKKRGSSNKVGISITFAYCRKTFFEEMDGLKKWGILICVLLITGWNSFPLALVVRNNHTDNQEVSQSVSSGSGIRTLPEIYLARETDLLIACGYIHFQHNDDLKKRVAHCSCVTSQNKSVINSSIRIRLALGTSGPKHERSFFCEYRT